MVIWIFSFVFLLWSTLLQCVAAPAPAPDVYTVRLATHRSAGSSNPATIRRAVLDLRIHPDDVVSTREKTMVWRNDDVTHSDSVDDDVSRLHNNNNNNNTGSSDPLPGSYWSVSPATVVFRGLDAYRSYTLRVGSDPRVAMEPVGSGWGENTVVVRWVWHCCNVVDGGGGEDDVFSTTSTKTTPTTTTTRGKRNFLPPCSCGRSPGLASRWSDLRRNPLVSHTEGDAPLALHLRSAVPLVLSGRSGDAWGRLLHDAGLTGSGEIIAIADTGIDYDNCLLSDASFGAARLPVGTPVPGHRKVAGLFLAPGAQGTAEDYPNGHGTTIASAAAGSIEPSNPAYNGPLRWYAGAAPGARIAMTSLARFGTLVPGSDVAGIMGQAQATLGAKTFSNSWGCGTAGDDAADAALAKSLCGSYSLASSAVDGFLWDDDESLVVFSAGNMGDNGAGVLYPANAKNPIAVGSSLSSTNGLVEATKHVDYDELRERLSAQLCATSWGNSQACCAPSVSGGCLRNEAACCAGQQVHRCCSAKEIARYQGFPWVWNERSLASFSSHGPTLSGRTKPDLVAPGAYISGAHSDGDPVSMQCGYGDGVVTSSTSRAALYTLGGTSVSAPIVAGAAALVREYLRRVRGMSAPSGYLRKAMVIHAARRLTGARTDRPDAENAALPARAPNTAYGFGRVVLENVIPVEDLAMLDNANATANVTATEATTPSMIEKRLSPFLLVRDRVLPVKVQLTAGDPDSPVVPAYGLCVAVDPRGSSGARRALRVTIAWYDPPSEPSATAGGSLVNDLDLALFSPGSDPAGLFGGDDRDELFSTTKSNDAIGGGGPAWLGNDAGGTGTADTANNVEMVHVPLPSSGAYRVVVWQRRGASLSRFALVATGPIVASLDLTDPLRSACDQVSMGTLGTDASTAGGATDAGLLPDGTTNEAPAHLIALAVITPAILVAVTLLALWRARDIRNKSGVRKELKDDLERGEEDGDGETGGRVDDGDGGDSDGDDGDGDDSDGDGDDSDGDESDDGEASDGEEMPRNAARQRLGSTTAPGPLPSLATPQHSSKTRLPPLSVASSSRSTSAIEKFYFDSPGGSHKNKGRRLDF